MNVKKKKNLSKNDSTSNKVQSINLMIFINGVFLTPQSAL